MGWLALQPIPLCLGANDPPGAASAGATRGSLIQAAVGSGGGTGTRRGKRSGCAWWEYRPAFPERVGSIQDARAYCHAFFPCWGSRHKARSQLFSPGGADVIIDRDSHAPRRVAFHGPGQPRRCRRHDSPRHPTALRVLDVHVR
jgi:hypothetical protein